MYFAADVEKSKLILAINESILLVHRWFYPKIEVWSLSNIDLSIWNIEVHAFAFQYNKVKVKTI